MKTAVFWDVTPCGVVLVLVLVLVLILVFLRSVRRLLVTANVVPSSPILLTMMMEALGSSETSAITRVTRRNISEEGVHQFTLLVNKTVHRVAVMMLYI
jgi:high-affinity Fe2+/Pb2+ permease